MIVKYCTNCYYINSQGHLTNNLYGIIVRCINCNKRNEYIPNVI